MITNARWRFKIHNGKAVIATHAEFAREDVFYPSDLQLKQDSIRFTRPDGLTEVLYFKFYKPPRYAPTIEELQNRGFVKEVEDSLLCPLHDIVSEYVMSHSRRYSQRYDFDLEYWLKMYKKYADVLHGVDWAKLLSLVPVDL